MVLGVCRRAIRDPNDVDDAFQATFMILVKKAGAIRDRDVLANWLYGVARRVAVRSSASARRRRSRERTMAEDFSMNDPRIARSEHEELRSLVDAELERLPERFRAPLVLCDVEGQTHEQAAVQIGCPVGTIKSRLARGRERLRARLLRRGVAPPLAVLASFFAAERALAVPPILIELTISAATKVAAGSALVATALAPGAAALTKGVIAQMMFKKLGLGAAAVSVALLAGGVTAFLVNMPMTAAQRKNGAAGSNPDAAAASASQRQDQGSKKNAAPDQAWSTPPVKNVDRFRLPNGMKIMLRPIKGTDRIALVVVYNIGSDHDPAGRSGIGHLVEHVYVTAAAGGTKARSVAEFAARYPEGANGQTGDRYTVFSSVFPAKDLERELTDAAARMADLRITTADLEREVPRLLEELDNMFVGFPPLAAQNQARELVRPTPRGGSHGGRPDQIRAMTAADVHSYWKRYYKPGNAIVALAGDLDAATCRKAIELHFAKIGRGEQLPAPGEPDQPAPGRPNRKDVASPNAGQTGPVACIAYKAPSPGRTHYAPFLVAVARLWASGEKLGGDQFGAMPVFFTPLDDGAFVALSSPLKAGESPAQAFTRLQILVRETISPAPSGEEVALARQQFSFLLGTGDLPDNLLAQNPYGVCFSLARREQLSLDPSKLDRALGEVTERDFRLMAKEIFDSARQVQTVVSAQK